MTVPSQDVFIRGGKSDGTPINIKINPLPENFAKYNAWAQGDDQLDWNGPAPGQASLAF